MPVIGSARLATKPQAGRLEKAFWIGSDQDDQRIKSLRVLSVIYCRPMTGNAVYCTSQREHHVFECLLVSRCVGQCFGNGARTEPGTGPLIVLCGLFAGVRSAPPKSTGPGVRGAPGVRGRALAVAAGYFDLTVSRIRSRRMALSPRDVFREFENAVNTPKKRYLIRRE